jgi:glycosyltransferase involved in cell wall biosynthesis
MTVTRNYGFEPSVTLDDVNVVAVIPAYNEGKHIGEVLRSLPSFLRHVVVVNDCSRDNTAEVVRAIAQEDPRVVLVNHDQNQGVGGAMVSGFRKALELKAQLVVKLDGDGQMDPTYLRELLQPLLTGEADFAKGNRFHDFRALARMPLLRRAGNMGLSFLTKAAVGYWNCFDPCNGYVAIRGDILAALPLEKLHHSYFFETSLLAQLYLLGGVIRDVPMPAIYGEEVSHLSITRVLVEFPPKLFICLLRRLLLKNFIYDFSMETVFLLAGLPLLVLGTTYGGYSWWHHFWAGTPAATGTVVIPAMLIILGFQLILSAIGEDLRAVPKLPLADGPLQPFAATQVGKSARSESPREIRQPSRESR